MKTFISLLIGACLGLSIDSALPRPKSFDEAKAERLAIQRDKRRAIEREYLSCLSACDVKCARRTEK